MPSSIIAGSPKEPEIQVRDRMNTFMSTPANFCRLGMIWMALDPLPITPTRLLVKSYLKAR